MLLGLALAAPALLPFAELRAHAPLQGQGDGRALWLQALRSRANRRPGAARAPPAAGAAGAAVRRARLRPCAGRTSCVLALAGLLGRGLDPALLAVALAGLALATAPPGFGWI